MRKPDLSKLSFTGGGVPTMIVPPGTQIQVDPQGQVSIRTPGNLVLQNSGAYAVLESVSGSIRVEPGVHVEAVTVRCADTCFVQGTLTAWRLVARTLHVEGEAEARVVMQETEHLEVERNGRVVGNFRSEKELFALFSRFAGHVRALPTTMPVEAALIHEDGAIDAEVTPDGPPEGAAGPAQTSPPAAVNGAVAATAVDADDDLLFVGAGTVGPSGAAAATADEAHGTNGHVNAPPELPDPLFLAMMLLEQEQGSPWTAAQRRVLDHLLALLRQADVETLRHTYKTLFARLVDGGEGVRRARRAVGAYFESSPPPPAV
jgi:hypothetical protein